MFIIDKKGKRVSVASLVRKYHNGPQDEKERLWRLNRKEFIRRFIRRDAVKAEE